MKFTIERARELLMEMAMLRLVYTTGQVREGEGAVYRLAKEAYDYIKDRLERYRDLDKVLVMTIMKFYRGPITAEEVAERASLLKTIWLRFVEGELS